MKENSKKFIQLMLPEDTIKKIDRRAKDLTLKRGPTCRMYLSEALTNVRKMESLELSFKREISAHTTLVAFAVTDDMNDKILDLCKYIPLSKKKICEILICQIVDSREEV